ncbi:hypothetical protein RV11_GL000276 [Enterococcus phoeniculicola]|nr:hypothetical protein RV11_GL000276 [Enterococcus phoeniculicola]
MNKLFFTTIYSVFLRGLEVTIMVMTGSFFLTLFLLNEVERKKGRKDVLKA